ncbi:Golgi-associated plant pathogenesis-related protein 1-like [Apostichopus japonicus]|uniref:Golgi-associated plant pathogenesis-related protein 1-like n=1 Tax=Stichopus japonicus TaxID=307972 RepID=UPI003AB80A90
MPELDEFQDKCLEAHNKLRGEHHAKKLQWNTELAESAKDWAKRVADKGYIQHSDSTRFGENIMMTEEDEDFSGEEAVQKWAREEALYDYTNPKWQKGTSHFTQIIWQTTTEVGIAKVHLESSNKYVIVVHYKPSGNSNKPGDYGKNVHSSTEINGNDTGTGFSNLDG